MAQYRVAADFAAESAGELSLKAGQLVEAVSTEVQNGWMEVRKASNPNVVGFVPASYLKPLSAKPESVPEKHVKEVDKSQNREAQSNGGHDSSHHHHANPFEQYEVSQPEKFKETLEFWRERERRFMAGEEEKLPTAKKRVYFYWDKSGVRHGPFMESAMREKLLLQEVTSQTPISLATEDEHPVEQKAVAEYFPSIDKAFSTVPVIKDSGLWWCYLDDLRTVQGPYSAETMYKWFQDGYFNAETLVRTSTQTDDQFVPLGSLFPDGAGAFLTPEEQTNEADRSANKPQPIQAPMLMNPPRFKPPEPAVPLSAGSDSTLNPMPSLQPGDYQPQEAYDRPVAEPYSNDRGFYASSSTRSFNPFDDALEDKGGWSIDATPNLRNDVSAANTGWNEVLLPPPQSFGSVPVDEFDPLASSASNNAVDNGKKLFIRAISHEEDNVFAELSPRANAPVAEDNDLFALNSAHDQSESTSQQQGPDDSKVSPEVANWKEIQQKKLQSINEIYTFLTRSVPKDLGVVRCRIIRSMTGGLHMNYNMYQLYLEKDDGRVGPELLRAVKHKRITLDSYYDIQLGAVARRDMGKVVGQLVENFSGTNFMLHNNVSSHRGPPKDLCVITYVSDKRKERGPRVMQVAIPAFKPGSESEFETWSHNGSIKKAEMVHAMHSLDFEKLQVFKNKPPKYNKRLQSYTLNFHGRATK